jgi:hypothetical protein
MNYIHARTVFDGLLFEGWIGCAVWWEFGDSTLNPWVCLSVRSGHADLDSHIQYGLYGKG